jgi:very-short-patch-repair endonuclease
MVIEIDGQTHGFTQAHDQARTAYFTSLGVRTMRLEARTVMNDPDRAAESLIRLCREVAPGPSTTQPEG